jgi:Iron-containing redox enzyme
MLEIDSNQLTLLDSKKLLSCVPVVEGHLEGLIQSVVKGEEQGLNEFHKLLAIMNQKKFCLKKPLNPTHELSLDILRTHLDTAWLTAQKSRIEDALLTLPQEPEAYINWLESLLDSGYGQNHRLFDYLENDASRADFKFFMTQELATEAGFDDLVAMTQVQAPHQVKLELARNYWDELGNGTFEKMHSVQLSWVADALNIKTPEAHYQGIFWQPLALSNMMLAYASRRSYFYQSIGALGAIELTAPSRCLKVTKGLKRLGFTNCQYRYYALHSVLDVKHWQGWRDEILRPLIQNNPEAYLPIAEGFLMRLLAGSDCFDVYAQHLECISKVSFQVPELALVS